MSSLHVPHPRQGTFAKIDSHKDDETISSSHVPHPRQQGTSAQIDSHIKTMKQCRLRMFHICVGAHFNKKMKERQKNALTRISSFLLIV